MNGLAGLGTYPLAVFTSATVSNEPLPVRTISLSSFLVALLRGLDCAIYSAGALVFLVLGVFNLIVEPTETVLWLVSFGAALVSASLVVFRFVSVRRALRFGEAAEAEVVRSAVGLVRLTGTPWGDLINGTAVRGSYRIRGTGSVADFYLQQRWAKSLKPGMKIWVITLNARPALLAPFLR